MNQSDNMVKAVQAQSNAATRRWFCLGLASGAAAFGLGCVGSRRSACENAAVRAAVRKYVEAGLYAGLACASSRGDMYLEGSLRIGGPKLPVTDESLFDLASVGKTQTAALCALLYADGRLDVDAPFTEYIPEHVLAKENCRITVRDLATHSGGFDNSKPYMVADPAAMFGELYRKRPVWPRGERFCYACSNFVYLGLIIENLTGLDLDAAARTMLWGPLGMSRTTWNTVVGYQDVAEYPQSTYGGPRRKIGEHNDICAHLAPRPMGNGANFSTAPDMLKFVTDMLRRERFPKEYYDLQLAPSFEKGGYRRSFGWEMTAEKSAYSVWTKTGFSSHAICHSGWTGSVIAVDPKHDFAGVVLGNRIASKEKTMGPRMKILDMMRTALVAVVACAALACRAAFAEAPDRSLMSDAYWEIWNDAEQARIDADIEANRKADGAFEVDAPDGAAVRVEQLTHDFRFGAHIFNFNQLGKTEYNDAYKASYGKGGLFNQATVAFYWKDYEPEPGKLRAQGAYEDTEAYWNSLSVEQAQLDRFWRRPAPGPVVDFLKYKDVRIHGHILVWGTAKPYWIYDWFCPEGEKRNLDRLGIPRHSDYAQHERAGAGEHYGFQKPWCKAWAALNDKMSEEEIAAQMPVFAKEMRRIFRKRVMDVGRDFGAVVDSWDVVNESLSDWKRYRNARTGLPVWKTKRYGIMPGDYPLNALLDAKEAMSPSADLCINETTGGIGPDFLQQVQQLEAEGAKIDVIGCQMHIFDTNACMRLAQGATDVRWVGTPRKIRETLDVMAKTGRPLHVSEVTIAAPGEDAKSRDIQAILVRNIYRAWFSHPKTVGITWWNTVDGGGVYGEPLVSGLFTRDMKKKPAYHALDRLINHEWKTALDVAAKGGKVAFRGFRGRYRLAWTGADGKPRSKLVELK